MAEGNGCNKGNVLLITVAAVEAKAKAVAIAAVRAAALAMMALRAMLVAPAEARPTVGGPAQKMTLFQMVPKSFLSVLIHSTR
jgi:hypothetical protein